MVAESGYYGLLFALLLFLSGFFSSSETAFFSISRAQWQDLSHSPSLNDRFIFFLLSHPQQLLITIIIGNTLVNVSLATVAALLTYHVSTSYALPEWLVYLLNVVVVTFVLLIAGEIIPKVVAVRNGLKLARIYAKPLMIIYFLLFPLSYIIHNFSEQLQKGLFPSTMGKGISEEEIKTLVEVGAEKGALHEDEKEMITSIFEFRETTVREIMIPRIDMKVIEKNTPLDEIIQLVKKTGVSRIPVYDGTIDNIIGILYVKDLLPFLNVRDKQKFHLEKLLHDPFFVPDNKKIHELLKDFQEEKIHMAIVVDEYGGVEGLVTLEDIIEEIVGEIQDEYDREEKLIEKEGDNVYLVYGKIPLEELEEVLPLTFEELEEEDVETLSGLLLHLFQDIPEKGEEIQYKNCKFTVLEIHKNRIQKVRIEILQGDTAENAGSKNDE